MNKDSNIKTKTYVLDTTAVIEDPEVMYKKANCEFVIPQVVIREIDGLKKSDKPNVAQAARTLSRDLDRMSEYADLKAGVQLSTGGVLRIYSEYETINDLDSDADNKIIGAAIRLKKEGRNVILVSTDTNLRVVAKLHGIKTRYSLLYDITVEEMKQAEKTVAARRRADNDYVILNDSDHLRKNSIDKGNLFFYGLIGLMFASIVLAFNGFPKAFLIAFGIMIAMMLVMFIDKVLHPMAYQQHKTNNLLRNAFLSNNFYLKQDDE